MKCEICKHEIKKTFLDKIMGTIYYDETGKKHYICNACQSKLSKNQKEVLMSRK